MMYIPTKSPSPALQPPPYPVSAWFRLALFLPRCAPLSCPGWRCPACSACLEISGDPGIRVNSAGRDGKMLGFQRFLSRKQNMWG